MTVEPHNLRGTSIGIDRCEYLAGGPLGLAALGPTLAAPGTSLLDANQGAAELVHVLIPLLFHSEGDQDFLHLILQVLAACLHTVFEVVNVQLLQLLDLCTDLLQEGMACVSPWPPGWGGGGGMFAQEGVA